MTRQYHLALKDVYDDVSDMPYAVYKEWIACCKTKKWLADQIPGLRGVMAKDSVLKKEQFEAPPPLPSL